MRLTTEFCFHEDDVDRSVDALVVLGVSRDLITRAMSTASGC